MNHYSKRNLKVEWFKKIEISSSIQNHKILQFCRFHVFRFKFFLSWLSPRRSLCCWKSLLFELRWRISLWYLLVLIAGWLSLLTLLNLFSRKKKSKTFVHSYGTIIEPSATKPISSVWNSKALLEFDPLLCLEWDAIEWLIEAGDRCLQMFFFLHMMPVE